MRNLVGLFALCLLVAPMGEASAQICRPVSQRSGELGCWITANAVLGKLPQQPSYWYLDTYSTRPAAEAAKGPRGTVVESLGKIWLLTIEAANWPTSGGARVAEIGPLPIDADASY